MKCYKKLLSAYAGWNHNIRNNITNGWCSLYSQRKNCVWTFILQVLGNKSQTIFQTLRCRKKRNTGKKNWIRMKKPLWSLQTFLYSPLSLQPTEANPYITFKWKNSDLKQSNQEMINKIIPTNETLIAKNKIDVTDDVATWLQVIAHFMRAVGCREGGDHTWHPRSCASEEWKYKKLHFLTC